jgi:hypothetical protein
MSEQDTYNSVMPQTDHSNSGLPRDPVSKALGRSVRVRATGDVRTIVGYDGESDPPRWWVKDPIWGADWMDDSAVVALDEDEAERNTDA